MPSNPKPLPVIAQVLHRLYLAGAEVLAAALARKLKDRYRFVFFCLDAVGPLGESLQSEGFTVVDLKRRPGVDLSVARRMREACESLGVDLLHAHQYTPFFYAATSRRLRATPPIFFTEHGRHYPDRRRPKRVWANKFLLRKHDRVTAVGQFVKQALVDNEGIPTDRIEVIYNGIDPRVFEMSPDPAAVRAEFGIQADSPIILQVARFHPVKDHATALRAFAALNVPALRSTPTLLLVGDGDERGKIESLAQELGVTARVRFAGVRQDIPRLMTASDVFLLSSLSEGISVTLLEAMACGVPIAATDVGGNGEVVAHGESGLLSPRGDTGALAASLAAILTDTSLRRRMGAAGKARLLEQFTQDRMHSGYTRVFEEMLGGSGT